MDSNDSAFDRQIDQARSVLAAQLAAVLALGALLLAALGVLQLYLTRRFRRILNPRVLAATVCALLAVLLGGQALLRFSATRCTAPVATPSTPSSPSPAPARSPTTRTPTRAVIRWTPSAANSTRRRSSPSRSSCTG